MLAKHSPLGASGASRWMKCPGSVSLTHGIANEESDFATEGTRAHTLAAYCLETGQQAWELMDDTVTKDMADAVQVYLDFVRTVFPERNQGNTWIERSFHCPDLHPLMYGQTDFAYLKERNFSIIDYKHGVGIVVEVKENPQEMYYAAAMLEDLGLWDAVDTIDIWVAQPRAYHSHGPIRRWSLSTDDLRAWVEGELIPAMHVAEFSDVLVSGDHCRFCPALKRNCPQIARDMDEAQEMTSMIQQLKGGVEELSNEQVARYLDLWDLVKMVASAANKTAFNRLSAGKVIPGRKLVDAKANRVWRDGAIAALFAEYGDVAYTTPELKSPAQIEKLPLGERLAAQWAFKPDTGLTVVKGDDSRPQVSQDTKSLFRDVTKKEGN
ncbi:MAG: DUF2800 domain-containing protein [Candidatus Methylomirabilis sp.]